MSPHFFHSIGELGEGVLDTGRADEEVVEEAGEVRFSLHAAVANMVSTSASGPIRAGPKGFIAGKARHTFRMVVGQKIKARF